MNASTLFKKLKVVDEQDVLRMIEKQLRQYDPALRAMARMKQEMDSTFMREDLSPEEKLTLLKANQQRFTQMKSGVGSVVQVEAPAVAAAPTQPALLAPDNEDEDSDVDEYHDSPSSPRQRTDSIASLQNDQGAATGSSTSDALGLYPRVDERHAESFQAFEKLLKNSENFLKPNPSNGELMIEGKSIPGSSFQDLVQALFLTRKGLNLKGQTEFIATMRRLAQNRTNGWPDLLNLCKLIPRTSIVKVLKAESLSPASFNNPVLTRAGKLKKGEQKGTGKGRLICKRKGFHSGPPGKRIKVMYLY